jgi:phosphoribosyl-ATP pyrophosphohydrolase
MTARLAKSCKDQRRHSLPATSIDRPLAGTDASAAAIAPAQARLQRGGGSGPDSREIERLYAALETVTAENHPRTARLLAAGNRKVAQKVIEEAGEVALAAVKRNDRNIVRESADLLYHLAVLWHRAGIAPERIWSEMRRRAETSGIAEKLPKAAAALRPADASAVSH